MRTQSPELIPTFRAARKVARRARTAFEPLRNVQELAMADGFKIKAHAGMVALDVLTSQEALSVQRQYGGTVNETAVETAVEAVKRSRTSSISEYKRFGLTRRVLIYEEGGGDLALGIPFDPSTQDLVADERDIIASCLSSVVRERVGLPEEDEYYLTVARMSEHKVPGDLVERYAVDVERALWSPSDGSLVLPSAVDLFDLEIYPSHAQPS